MWGTGTAELAGALLAGYLAGSVPFGLLLTRIAGLGDIRRIGSGNIGATNVLRTGRHGLAALTLLLDGGKGAAAVLLARALLSPDAALLAGLGAMLGHVFPVWLGFRGGKGVATALGILLALAWPVGVAAMTVWALAAAVFRYSSLAALAAIGLSPVAAILLPGGGAPRGRLAILALAVAALVFVRHETNIRRLLAGTEPRIGRRAGSDDPRPPEP